MNTTLLSRSETRTQLRGICQCCGRQQAVVSGFMSKHGYTVKNGWFSGVCTGQHFAPLQTSREQADKIVRQVRAECLKLRAHAAALEAGTERPAVAASGRRIKVEGKAGFPFENEMVAFELAPEWFQVEAVRAAIWRTTQRAEIGERFASDLEALAAKYHGQPLLEVPVEAAAAPLALGEQRKAANGRVLTVASVRGQRVYWKDERGFKSWTGLAAWRKLPAAS